MDSVVTQANERLLNGKEPQELCSSVCRVLVETGGYTACWVGLLKGQSGHVEPVATAGFDGGYARLTCTALADVPQGTDPIGTALREHRHHVCNDIQGGPSMRWRDEALGLGYRAMAAFPLRTGHGVMGILAICASETGFFDPESVRSLDCLALSLSFALRSLEHEQEGRRLEKQLRQAQKMEAIGQLAGGVAHDFSNLLFIINGRAEMILERLKPGDPLLGQLELICRTGERAAHLIRQLLAFSRHQVLQPEVLDLNAIIGDVEKMLRRLVREDILLATCLDPNLKATKADKGQIEQVLMNLVVNARDAMPKGGKLTIETRNADLDEAHCRQSSGAKPGRYVMFAVSDTGCGMDDNTKAHIFEPFFTTKVPGKGTGLGLATANGIVEQSGGSIEVCSELGKGATFKVYLPAVGAKPARLSQQIRAVIARGNETILLVEDEEEVLGLAREILKSNGYTVLSAANGAEALQICEQHKGEIHLALCDVVMPGMGGTELARQLRQLRPGIKVLFMSGYAEEPVAEQDALGSSTQFIQKPVTSDALARKVREALDGA